MSLAPLVVDLLEKERAKLKRQKADAEGEIRWGEQFLAGQRKLLNEAIDGIIVIEEELRK